MMKKNQRPPSTKYHTEASSEFEPGSRNKVLRNLLHITSVREMEDAELVGYMEAEQELLRGYHTQQRLNAEDIRKIHRMFLGKIYSWAGEYRSVNISKGGFMFAAATAIPSAMKEFESTVLNSQTPCVGKTLSEVAEKIAIVHVELLLIHPFREGNGRAARLLATLMAYQADFPGIDFSFIGSKGKEFDRYISAIHHGVKREYTPMQKLIERAMKRDLKL